MTNHQLATGFFLQVACLLAACRIVGVIARRFGQPQVVAEMITGILLGPSFLGLAWPSAQSALFPRASMPVIYVAAQVGLGLYMFLVGMEFQRELVAEKLKAAATISLTGIFVPFVFGAVLALYMLADGRFFSAEVGSFEATLFLGAAMSVTAFPVLARIISDRGISGTMLGTITLAAGATDDAAAWTLLSIVLASISAKPTVALWTVGGGLLYTILVLTVGRRLLTRLSDVFEREQRLTAGLLAAVLTLLCVGSWFTDLVGIESVFGAFILGTAMPRGRFARELRRMVEPLSVNFLLPLFFVYSGLNTSLVLVNTPRLVFTALLVTVVASVGKGVACWAAARVSGLDSRNAAAVGALMNTRGLMELIILNVGLERGIISQTLFTMMVLMAIATTVAAGPVFEWIYRRSGVAETVGMSMEMPIAGTDTSG